MNPLELRDFKSDPKAFLSAGPIVIEAMLAHAPPSRGGIAIDATDQLELVKYVPADAQRTFHLKAERLGAPATGRKVTMSEKVLDGGSSVTGYYLGWRDDEAHVMTLPAIGPNDWFLTARMNGCCVYIGGTRETPTVVHANTKSSQLDVDGKGMSLEAHAAAMMEHQAAMYRKLYSKLAEKLVFHQHLRDPITVFDPPNYRLLNGYVAHVWGLRRSDGWSFYCNYERVVGATKTFVTHELWPNFALPE